MQGDLKTGKRDLTATISGLHKKLPFLVNTRPEISLRVSILSQVTEKSYIEEYVKTMNDIIKHVTASTRKVLNYKKLDL